MTTVLQIAELFLYCWRDLKLSPLLLWTIGPPLIMFSPWLVWTLQLTGCLIALRRLVLGSQEPYPSTLRVFEVVLG